MSYFRRKNGSGVYIEVEFEFMGKMFREEIDLPWELFAQAFVQYANFKEVGIDGRDKSVWNLLVDLGAIDSLTENSDFLQLCKDLYLESKYFEEDQEEWLEQKQDDYDSENNLGEYAPKKDGE